MKPFLLQILTFRAALAAASPIIQQHPLAQFEVMAEPEGALKVPGYNNATYGPVPKVDQLFQVEFLDIAPSPIPVDQFFFVFLRGKIPPSKKMDVEHLDGLANATLSFTLSVVFPDSERGERRTYTIPLRTRAFGDAAHLSIRDAEGAFVNYITSSGRNDIVTDFSIPSVFVQTGMWTFEVEARLGDGTCLFAMSLTQWLEGRPW
ncbi:hypothetical protein DL764_007717 [Monosporascus ibericus]|uniref:Uncharacterized protein n=1 Tax=Monosporascus ibericus TaxID=155417 RepID=A0A4Q4T2S6_9PEZI|nr:hypothetical protein DL764_007717 [Monosporascus ibericus]